MNHMKIILKAKEFYKYVARLASDPTIEAIEVKIYEFEDFDTSEIKKHLSIDILESGGLGLIENENDPLEEMTEEEILDIK